MPRYRLSISYDGTPFQGWQKQPQKPSVQSELEAALSKILNQPIRTIGSGRTDAGTHAINQVVHFDADKLPSSRDNWVRGLNSLLPDSITVKSMSVAPEDFHAQRSAVAKTYIYRIWNHPIRSSLWRDRALWVPHSLDVELLQTLSQPLIGEHDFRSFQTQGTPVKSTIRRIYRLEWRGQAGRIIELRVRGSGFLKQMVRNMVGTLLYLERQRAQPTRMVEILQAHDRSAAKGTAPAHGLYLYRVEYPRDLDNKCRKL